MIRQKIQGQNISWYIVEQMPVVPPDHYESVHFGSKTAGEIVRDGRAGTHLFLPLTTWPRLPATWTMSMKPGRSSRRLCGTKTAGLHLRAKLDAVFFHLYGVTDPR